MFNDDAFNDNDGFGGDDFAGHPMAHVLHHAPEPEPVQLPGAADPHHIDRFDRFQPEMKSPFMADHQVPEFVPLEERHFYQPPPEPAAEPVVHHHADIHGPPVVQGPTIVGPSVQVHQPVQTPRRLMSYMTESDVLRWGDDMRVICVIPAEKAGGAMNCSAVETMYGFSTSPGGRIGHEIVYLLDDTQPNLEEIVSFVNQIENPPPGTKKPPRKNGYSRLLGGHVIRLKMNPTTSHGIRCVAEGPFSIAVEEHTSRGRTINFIRGVNVPDMGRHQLNAANPNKFNEALILCEYLDEMFGMTRQFVKASTLTKMQDWSGFARIINAVCALIMNLPFRRFEGNREAMATRMRHIMTDSSVRDQLTPAERKAARERQDAERARRREEKRVEKERRKTERGQKRKNHHKKKKKTVEAPSPASAMTREMSHLHIQSPPGPVVIPAERERVVLMPEPERSRVPDTADTDSEDEEPVKPSPKKRARPASAPGVVIRRSVPSPASRAQSTSGAHPTASDVNRLVFAAIVSPDRVLGNVNADHLRKLHNRIGKMLETIEEK